MRFFKKNKLLLSIIFFGFLLRGFGVNNSPPSLYWDEVSLGYNSFAISQTAHDEHGKFLPIDAFTAFGDYKPPLYIYLTVPFVKLFGLNYLNVRTVSIISGTFLIIIAYLIAKEIFPKNKKYKYAAGILVCISPWSIQMSRAAFEANLATTLSAAATLFFIKAKNNPKLYLVSSLFFVLAMYTFNGTRYFLPVWILTLFLWRLSARRLNKTEIKSILVSVVFSFVLILPLIQFGLTGPGRLRFDEVNIFSDPEPVIKSNRLQQENGNSLISKIIFNRRIFHAQNFIGHYLDHYSPKYLFMTGDVNPRFSSQSTGQLYIVEALLIPLGFLYLFKKNKKYFYLMLLWITLAPIPASIARETPHALRTLHILPSLMLVSAAGIIFIIESIKGKTLRIGALAVIILSFLIQSFYFSYNYLFLYPEKFGAEWQDGYKQLAQSLKTIQNQYPKILVTDYYGRAYINLLYYWKYDPEKYLNSRDAFSEASGLWTVKGFDNLNFKQSVTCADSASADLLIGLPADFENISEKQVVRNSSNKAKFVMIKSNDCKK